MTESEDIQDRFGEDPLDLGIRAAFGPPGDAAGVLTRSALRRLGQTQKMPQVVLRDDDAKSAPVLRAPEPQDRRLLRQIDRYQIVGEIARGGIGSVLKARDVDLGRDVALKVLLGDHRGNAEMTRRFFEEAQIAGQLEHPGIVPVHEIGLLADERPYFTMKLVKGQTLAELLESRASLPQERQHFLGIFKQVCQTLAYAHSRGVIHRDLKPSNVMVGAFGEVQVMDWGLAKVIPRGGAADDKKTTQSFGGEEKVKTARSESQGSSSIAGSVMGTPAYMSPEQARGAVDELDQRSDVFGLGAILCEVLTGKPPYAGRTVEEVHRKAREGDQREALARLESCGTDGEMVELTRDCLAFDPQKRPRSAIVVSSRISSHLESLESRARTLELRATRARFRLVLLLTILVAFVLGSGGYLWNAREQAEREARTRETVTQALRESTALRARAGASRDLSLWDAALRESERALDLAGKGTDPGLLEQARNLSASLAQEVEDQRDIRELESLRANRDSISPEDLDESYRDFFSSRGIDIEAMEPEVAADAIRQRDIATELILALDEWAALTRIVRRGGRDAWEQLLQVAQMADDDPWRRRLREAVRSGDNEARETLETLADDLRERKVEPSTLEMLARSLRRLRSASRSTSVWFRAQAAYPDDFWTNMGLAEALRKDGRGADAVQYLRSAVALRPRSANARCELGSALADQGQIQGAANELTTSIEIDPNAMGARAFIRCSEILGAEGSEVSKEDIADLIKTLEKIRDSGREYHHDALTLLLAKAHFQLGAREIAILILEDSIRLRGEAFWPWFGWWGGPGSRSRSRSGPGPGPGTGRADGPGGPPRPQPRLSPAAPDAASGPLAPSGTSPPSGSNPPPAAVVPSTPAPAQESTAPVRPDRPRGPPTVSEQLAEYRKALLPDLVSYASIDAALDSGGDAAIGSLPEGAAKFQEFCASGKAAGSEARLAYLRGRLLQREGKLAEAAAEFARAVPLDRTLPEPFLHLAECLRASKKAAEAEKVLRDALASERLQGFADLWTSWVQVSFGDLARSAEDLLDSFPLLRQTPRVPESDWLRFPVDYGSDLQWCLECLVRGKPIRINCGGQRYDSPDGTAWERDRFFARASLPAMPHSGRIEGTKDEPLFRTHRWFPEGSEVVGYKVPLPPGDYEVKLHFAEIVRRDPRRRWPEQRIFDVTAEGTVVRESYEPQKEAGFATATSLAVKCRVADGFLDIKFVRH